MTAVWAAGMLLRRLRTERGIAFVIFALVAGTSFVFAAAPRLFDRVSDEALRHAVRVAPSEQRNITLDLSSTVAPGVGGGVTGVRALGDQLMARFPPSVLELISSPALRVTAVRLNLLNPPNYTTRLSLRYQDGLPEATRLVAGHWPVDHGATLRLVGPENGSGGADPGPAEPAVLEAAFSSATAAEIGVQVGDRLAVELDVTDPLLQGSAHEIVPTDIEVAGLYEPLDAKAAYWAGDTGLLRVTRVGNEDFRPIDFATAYIPEAMYPSLYRSALPFAYEWRYDIDPERLSADQAVQLRAGLRQIGLTEGLSPSGAASTVAVRTGLPGILDQYAADVVATETVLSLAAIGPLGMAGGAMAMAAILLGIRRRFSFTLVRGRGATGGLVLGTELWEAALLAGGATLVGLLLAIWAVPSGSSPMSVTLAIAVGATATLFLVGGSWSIARRPLGDLERDEPRAVRAKPRRLVVEGTIVVIAVAATALVRQRGLTVGQPGTTARIDPLLASVPVLCGLAGGIVAMRAYPVLLRGLGWVAARRHDLVPVLGLRTSERLPAAANLPLLVLMLTAAFGAFSAVIASSLDHAQVVASYLEVGADDRIESIDGGSPTALADPATIPGVEAVAGGRVDTSAAFATTADQRASIELEAIDPVAYETVTTGTAADPSWPLAFLVVPPAAGAGQDSNPIPALISQRLPAGSRALAPGDTFRMAVDGQQLTFRVVDQRASFAGIVDQTPFAVVPLGWINAAVHAAPVAPSVLWLRAAGAAEEQLEATFSEASGTVRLVSRRAVYGGLRDAPLGAAVLAGYGGAVLLSGSYLAIALLGSFVLSAARRRRDLAYLRTLGVTSRQGLALTLVETVPPVVLALGPGIALGIGVALLCEPGLGLTTFTGSGSVPLFVDWPLLALIVAALGVVVAAAFGAGTWLMLRSGILNAMRVGD